MLFHCSGLLHLLPLERLTTGLRQIQRGHAPHPQHTCHHLTSSASTPGDVAAPKTIRRERSGMRRLRRIELSHHNDVEGRIQSRRKSNLPWNPVTAEFDRYNSCTPSRDA